MVSFVPRIAVRFEIVGLDVCIHLAALMVVSLILKDDDLWSPAALEYQVAIVTVLTLDLFPRSRIGYNLEAIR